MVIFSLLSTAVGSVFYGIVATAAIMAVLYFALRTLSEGAVRSIPFYVAGVLLAVLLTIQLSLMIGAVKANGMVDSIEITINQMMEGKQGTFGINDSQRLLDHIIEEYPLLGVYVGNCDFSGNDTTTIAASMAESMHDFLSSYIWHRVWWALGFIVVACLIALMFDKGKGERVQRGRTERSYARRDSRVSTTRHNRYR